MRFEHEVVIDQPPEEVFRYLTEPDNLPAWQKTVVETRKEESDRPLALGSRFTEVRTFLGRRIESQLEVTELAPNHIFSLRVISGPVLARVRHVLEPSGAGTRLSVTTDGDAGGLAKLGGPLVARQARKQGEADFANLKRTLERG